MNDFVTVTPKELEPTPVPGAVVATGAAQGQAIEPIPAPVVEPEPVAQPVVQGEVIATGTAVNSVVQSLGERIEKAMVDAINACYAQGITDAPSILAAKMAAFEKVKASV